MLSGVSIVCFSASYAVSLTLEVSQLFVKIRVRRPLTLGFAGAGLLAHTVYLVLHPTEGGAPLSSWYHWCLAVAWVVAAVYLLLTLSRPQASLGIFLLPLVLGLLGLAHLFRGLPHFSNDQATGWWATLHGVALLLGTVVVFIGFSAGLMYLLQVYRLKQKRPPQKGLRLPSLEWLQRANESSLIVSSLFVGIGLVTGIALDLTKYRVDSIGQIWADPVVWSSAVLLLWLIIALVFNAAYKPARQGRKIAYLTVASFVFLILALSMALLARHASDTAVPITTGAETVSNTTAHTSWGHQDGSIPLRRLP